jgi:hypothetical protein
VALRGYAAPLGHAEKAALLRGSIALDRFWCGLAVDLSTEQASQLQEILKLQNLDYRFL